MTRTEKPKFTPTWMTIAEAARGWGVSKRHAWRIVRAAERESQRAMSSHGRIRVSDYLTIPRGDVAAAPMIPDVAILWDKFEELAAQQQRMLNMLGRVSKRVGLAAEE